MIKRVFIVAITLFLFGSGYSYAQTPPASQTAGGLEKTERAIEKEKELQERITTEKKAEEEKEVGVEETAAAPAEERKILIKAIEVRGATLISEEVVSKIKAEYEGKEITIKDMQKICDLITDEYRKKGHVTSRAYLPPQTIKDGLLIIMVTEGQLGSVDIKGNRYFKTALLKKKLLVKEGGFFDYKSLQKSLRDINEHPDRFAKAILVPGEKPGQTDIVLEVKDRLPVHAGLNFDNFGSRYVEKYNYAATLEHNNFLGWDDRVFLKYQRSQSDFQRLKSVSYTIPLNSTFEAGGSYLWSKMKLGKEFEDVDVRGRTEIVRLFLNQTLIDEDLFDLKLNFGFDYKHIENYTASQLTSRDEVRIFRMGFDLDNEDKWGRTIFTMEEDIGIPDLFGGAGDKDPLATRAGAGGKFFKLAGNVYRLQPMPFDSQILWKNQFQLSNYTLPASEQFQIGGIANVRGYPPAEYSGDRGFATSVEWSFPPYFIPKDTNIPLTQSKLYDAMKFVVFYDLGVIRLKKELAGERKHRTLRGVGFGLRMNLPQEFSVRLEFAYPLAQTPSDENHLHPYISVNKRF